MTSTVNLPPSPEGTNHRRRRVARTLAAAVLAVTVVVAITVALRGGSSRNPSNSAFEPTPWPDGQLVSTSFQTGASYKLPTPHQIPVDDKGYTIIAFHGHAPPIIGEIWVKRLPWHPTAQSARVEDLPNTGDKRVRVLQRQPTEVDSAAATRFLLEAPPYAGDLYWFCTSPSKSSCIGLERGLTTAYLLKRDDSIIVIRSMGPPNHHAQVRLGRVVDGMAATWRWSGQ